MKTFDLNQKSFFCFVIALILSYGNITNAKPADLENKTLSPYFVVISKHPETDNLPLKETKAKVSIVGVIADVTIRQVYVNSGKNAIEAVYTFPLSTNAAVYAMEMKVGSRILTARIEEKQKARAQYEAAKNEGKRTSLLEQDRPNVFTMNVANIVVNDTIVVEVKYTELLVPEQGTYSFVYPTVVGPRYSNQQERTEGNDADYASVPYTREGVMPAYNFGIEMQIKSGVPIQSVTCSTHKMNISQPDIYMANISLDSSEANGGNRDVIVTYSLQGNKIESGIMLYEGDTENFFMVMIQPPKRIVNEEIPPREYIFIVDVSGSMYGFPLEISKKLLRNLIVNLEPSDKFNVVLFAGSAGLLNPTSMDATQPNLNKALSFIDEQRGGGGTELMNALETAYRVPPSDADVSRSYVIVSDGYVTIEKEAFEFIRKNGGTSNVFSFGIGSSVNRYLMEGLAFMGSGEAIIVTGFENADAQAEKFRNYINTPVLTQIKTDFESFSAYDVEPSSPPDMLAERPIIIFGKYKGKAAGSITVKGKTGRSPYKQTFDISKVVASEENSAFKYLCAREKIKLLDYYSNGRWGERNNTTTAEITALGLKYNLVTNYTSFIAVDEQIVVDKDGKPTRVKQPNPLPQGVSNFAVAYSEEISTMASRNIAGARGQGTQYYVDGVKVTSMAEVEVVSYMVPLIDAGGGYIDPREDSIYAEVESMPGFPGGDDSLQAFIKNNLIYPEKAKEKGITGTVDVYCVIEKNGRVSNVWLINGVNYALNRAALKVVRQMPNWIPGKQDGKAVRVQMKLPIKFSLG